MDVLKRTFYQTERGNLQVETEVPPLESFVGWEVVRRLKPKEKKRQEVINGLLIIEMNDFKFFQNFNENVAVEG